MTTQAVALNSADLSALRNAALERFQGQIPPAQVPLLYRIGLFFVAVAMVLLPLVYIGLIYLAGYAVYYHATQHTGIFQTDGSGRGKVFGVLLIYFGPIVVGGIMVLFMIKPLFAGRPKDPVTRKLRREDEPFLFAFVERLCRTVGAPAPREIRVDCEINASASFRRGIWSMLGKGDLVLTIGLPIVLGLNLRQLTGVLAHEFGHFSQAAGMRLTYVIRSINAWFARVVYERDAWDEALTQWSQEIDLRIGIVLYLARFFVWLTRKILWLLMVIGHGISCFMLRQMEYDADRYEVQVAGSKSFEQTMERMTELALGMHWAQSDLQELWQEGHLADDLPAFVKIKAGKIPDDARRKILAKVRESKTGLFDTHPADADRVAAARRVNSKGLFGEETPASVLFSDFKGLSRIVTLSFYRDHIGLPVKKENLRDLDDLLERQDREQSEMEALGRYFQNQINPMRPLAVAVHAPAPAGDPGQALGLLKAARERMVAAVPAFSTANKIYRKAKGERRRQELVSGLTPLEDAARERLALGLQLLHQPGLDGKLPEAPELRAEVARLLPLLNQLREMGPALQEVSDELTILGEMVGQLDQRKNDEAWVRSLLARINKVGTAWRAAVQTIPAVPYPFEHADGQVPLRKFLVTGSAVRDDLGQTAEAAQELLSKSVGLYIRVLGRLAMAAEKAEVAAGLEPLPDPPKTKDDEGE